MSLQSGANCFTNNIMWYISPRNVVGLLHEYNIYRTTACKTILPRVLNITHPIHASILPFYILLRPLSLSLLYLYTSYVHATVQCIYIFLTVSLYIIAPAPHVLYTYVIRLTPFAAHFLPRAFIRTHEHKVYYSRINVCTCVCVLITLQIRRLIRSRCTYVLGDSLLRNINP